MLTTLTGIQRTVDADLTAIAQRRAAEIQVDFSHNGWDPSTAEIIAYNSDPDPVTRLALQWQGSPAHWTILVDPQYTLWGCAISQAGDATYGVCLFRSGPSPPATVAPAPSVDPAPTPPTVLLPNTSQENPMTNQQPVALNVAIAGFVSSAVTLAAIFWPDRLSPEVQGSIIALANSAIVVVTIILTQRQVTPIHNATLAAGTSVKVEGSEDTVDIQPTPPGPTGTEGGPEGPG